MLAAVYAVTIVGSAVGEWAYCLMGSAVEVVLLGALVYHAWTCRETVGQVYSFAVQLGSCAAGRRKPD